MKDFLRRLFGEPKPTGKLVPECLSVVTVTADHVECHHPKEDSQILPWSELIRVELLTNDQGPWSCDVYWHLVGEKSECFVPQGATGEQDLIVALERLPGFSKEAMSAAMCCTDNQEFVCWQRK